MPRDSFQLPKFIQYMTFTKNWDRLGLDDDDLRSLEEEIIAADDPGVVIKGGGGAR